MADSSDATTPTGSSSGSTLVFFIILFVFATTLPMTLDLLQLFLPRRLLTSRLVASWQRPCLITMVLCLCAWALRSFFPIAAYSYAPGSTAWRLHLFAILVFWLNTIWNYAMCAAIDPGFVHRDNEDFEHDEAAQLCRVCKQRVLHFDHHCPFTGGCIGARNYRFFALFVLHCTLGCGWACGLALPPFRDCVVSQMSMPRLGLVRSPPPDDAACVRLGARSLLLLPALMLTLALALLGAFHFVLLANGLTTLQFTRRWRKRGLSALLDLLALWRRRGGGGGAAAETDKWALLWGEAAGGTTTRAAVLTRARILALPSLPLAGRHIRGGLVLGPGIADSRAWLASGLLLASLLLLVLPLAATALEHAGWALSGGSAATNRAS